MLGINSMNNAISEKSSEVGSFDFVDLRLECGCELSMTYEGPF